MDSTPVSVFFSDLDGTLVHYPKEISSYCTVTPHGPSSATITYNDTNESRECTVLTSKTGGDSYISNRTIELIAELRSLGVVFVIITGARTSTYIKRRPFLPPADFEFFENGGRKLHNGVLDPLWTDKFESQVGPIANRTDLLPSLESPDKRDGSLWCLYRHMVQEGWTVDAVDYTTNFRVDVGKTEGKTDADLANVIAEECEKRGLASSFNLGKADFYPAGSGKANAASHILHLLSIPKEQGVAMFDDDNDLELGRLCGRSFLPGVTHPSVLEEMKKQPSWTLTEKRGVLGTEAALEEIIRLRKRTAAEKLAAS
eukprot:GFKZ01009140.1.p1 GENE.GFKZ01009140.1~~GFKZ01009140.1.p1  ORF type:complete len:315 (-),score=46.53 GFKZ01009140.1:488-1432(-)